MRVQADFPQQLLREPQAKYRPRTRAKTYHTFFPINSIGLNLTWRQYVLDSKG